MSARCACNLPYAAHSLGEAAEILGTARQPLFVRCKKYGIGRLINGQWHFRLDELRQRRPVGRPRQPVRACPICGRAANRGGYCWSHYAKSRALKARQEAA